MKKPPIQLADRRHIWENFAKEHKVPFQWDDLKQTPIIGRTLTDDEQDEIIRRFTEAP